MVMIRNVFLYLDRTYVRDTPGTQSLWCVARAPLTHTLTRTHAQTSVHPHPAGTWG